jgi:hypothetical protein
LLLTLAAGTPSPLTSLLLLEVGVVGRAKVVVLVLVVTGLPQGLLAVERPQNQHWVWLLELLIPLRLVLEETDHQQ